jgi:hypothetical protein
MEESRGDRSCTIGILVDCEIDLSTRYGNDRVFDRKQDLIKETTYQQDLIKSLRPRITKF